MNTALLLFLMLFIVCVLATALKVLLGATLSDRLIAAAMSTHILTFVLAVAGIYGESDLAFDAALVAALISFSATVITAKFLGRERVL
jgi:multisubunit Na+/H+ antiporter MnhF subunit